jgi:heme/copper-type cytochrome/quinol oxidase subunit 1
MVLATVIRLELAYPGVGIFAGDSLQYLSLVSAHGVIMVFFMIMPLLFGAFANFLLPTQLGVHDVAFPRLNSAAFWFLPAGLIMLAQLVCVDRRYQRMNCFNIREVQSLLKRRFFTDLINTNDHRNLLNETMMGVRFKTNNLNSTNPNMFLFYNYGLELASKNRLSSYTIESENFSQFSLNSLNFRILQSFTTLSIFNTFNNLYMYLIQSLNFINSISFIALPFTNFIGSLYCNFDTFYKNQLINIFNHLFSITMIVTSWAAIFPTERYYFDIFTIRYYWPSVKTFFTSVFDLINLFKNIWIWINAFSFEFSLFPIFPSIIVWFHKNFAKSLFDYFNFISIIIKQSLNAINNVFKTFKNILISIDQDANKEFVIDLPNPQLPNYFFLNLFEMLKTFNDDSFLLNIENIKHEFINKIPLSFWQQYFNVNFSTHSLPYWYVLSSHTLNLNEYDFNYYIIFSWFENLPFYLYYFITDLTITEKKNVLKSTWEYFVFSFFPWWQNNKFEILIQSSLFKNFFFLNELESRSFFAYFYLKTLNLIKFNDINNTQDLSSYCASIVSNIIDFCYLTLLNFFVLINILIFSNKPFFIFENFINLNFIRVTANFKSFNNFFKNEYQSLYFTNLNSINQYKFNQEESSLSPRFHKFDNPLFKYDFKSGDYYPKIYSIMHSHLINTALQVGSLRFAPWFFAANFFELFDNNFTIFYDNILKKTATQPLLHAWTSNHFNATHGFYNFFFTLNNEHYLLNERWISMNALNQKFYRMFSTSSMQQRIYSNWRQLKFTREAWRCKLLSARHQKTLYKRYVNEDGVFWSIERNAKDLLPGWAMITPFSSRTRFTAIGKVDIGLMGVLLVLNSSIISGANFLVTYRYLSTLNNRKMRDARSFFTEGVMVASWMMIFANPMLVIGIIMLLSDRHWQTSFFDYSGGGDTVLFQHMFWFFGHPEVYVIVIPTFGFTNTILSYYLKKRISARASLMYSMYTIAFLGFFVWGHHMYMVGLAHTTRMLFSTLTVMISVPAATKLMHWCVTLVNSAITWELPLICTLTFVFFFVSGGISGMAVAHTGMDILFHDTFYVIGHFHVMLAGAAMIGSFGAFYFYFVAIFGVKYSRIYAYLHYIYYLLGQLFTVIPMFWLGYAGMPRRILDYPASLGGWHSIISGGHMLSVAGLIAFFIMIFDSLRQAKTVVRNTFGIGRYNTRLNFYIYEIARVTHVQKKGWTLFKFNYSSSIKLNALNYTNLEHLETTLFSYTFYKNLK